jgi:hypothetical protein
MDRPHIRVRGTTDGEIFLLMIAVYDNESQDLTEA